MNNESELNQFGDDRNDVVSSYFRGGVSSCVMYMSKAYIYCWLGVVFRVLCGKAAGLQVQAGCKSVGKFPCNLACLVTSNPIMVIVSDL